ncbi:hypothetical protein LCGC14_0277980 [marine sediment metagenome]|uniref:Uncharacterized protein n=1 Tax=marine sediment metagenome TaxID=412755 RepID=A0A0F9U1Q2_9ZZZZ
MDYLTEVRNNLQAAKDRKAIAIAEENRKQRGAKFGIILLIAVMFTVIILFGDNIANWC